ncbi:MAG: DNA polymerase subunit beta [Candidatus Saganbacteria bacterium]|uniref:DNA polymerase subunit beta n=1 Tax=Candidatus Saganbacteria bacterium TaxID=2575572 RepID=A0A833L1D0_UNCSA|nr:MAG: DNA polymerase subunit beta [Candidatus Saganbacteria bacterium]
MKEKNFNNLIKDIVNKIVKGSQPEKVILFGSAVKHSAKTINDLDFLVVKASNLRRDIRGEEIKKSLTDVIFPIDIFVYTPEEYKKFKNLSGSFVSKIEKTGKTLYESK